MILVECVDEDHSEMIGFLSAEVHEPPSRSDRRPSTQAVAAEQELFRDQREIWKRREYARRVRSTACGPLCTPANRDCPRDNPPHSWRDRRSIRSAYPVFRRAKTAAFVSRENVEHLACPPDPIAIEETEGTEETGNTEKRNLRAFLRSPLLRVNPLSPPSPLLGDSARTRASAGVPIPRRAARPELPSMIALVSLERPMPPDRR